MIKHIQKNSQQPLKQHFQQLLLLGQKNIYGPWREVLAVAVGGYAVYYFINDETEDLYTFIKYYYRELGEGFFDHNGTFIGDYEIKKEIRVTANSDGTGGNVSTDERESSIIEPWF
ncbi:hypothetical protein [Paenibacillus chungangensis]|uniref:Uncharacterized protein n=1 Tax=Paenibacillus chungangensis TaxID=696535 RepID=A0ABW3HST6_9BACL